MHSFFDKNYQAPQWLKNKTWFTGDTSPSRRIFLKSAAGALATTTISAPLLASNNLKITDNWQNTPLWQTLNAVLNHLLPESKTGPSAQDIKALNYLHNVVTLQPIAADEITFIKKGVGWLNGFSQSQLSKPFVELSNTEKESILRGISGSNAGNNWLSTLLGYVFEAMLTPPIYGGNPNGIGEKWLKHQAGFPLPSVGTRYYELPGSYRIAINSVSPSTKIAPEKRINKA